MIVLGIGPTDCAVHLDIDQDMLNHFRSDSELSEYRFIQIKVSQEQEDAANFLEILHRMGGADDLESLLGDICQEAVDATLRRFEKNEKS